MDFAIAEISGKQYKINKGMVLDVEKLDAKPNENYTLDKILLYVNGDNVTIGDPYVSGLKATAKIEKEVKSDKIRVAKYKAKSKYRRARGYRQVLSRIKIEDIKKI